VLILPLLGRKQHSPAGAKVAPYRYGTSFGRTAQADTARVSDCVRDTLEQAAELLGATVNQFVDAKDQDAKRCYEQFGFVSLPANELELFLPVKTIQEALKLVRC